MESSHQPSLQYLFEQRKPSIAFRQLPSTDGFAQLGVVLEGAAARLQAVAGAHHQRQQPHQRHGASVQGVGNFRRSQRLIYERNDFLALNQQVNAATACRNKTCQNLAVATSKLITSRKTDPVRCRGHKWLHDSRLPIYGMITLITSYNRENNANPNKSQLQQPRLLCRSKPIKFIPPWRSSSFLHKWLVSRL